MTKGPLPTPREVLAVVIASLDHGKALDVVVIDLARKTNLADFMVIASGTSKRHVASMTDHIVENLHAQGLSNIAVEGQGEWEWALIDAGDVVVNLFRPEVREFYALERLWGDAPVVMPRSHDRTMGIGAAE